MEAKPGRLVKALYDFPTDDAAELPLLVGDIVQVTERVDKQWSRGVSADREGNFPIGFTVDLKISQLADHQELFAVTNDFFAQEEGDLTLRKGDLVIGNNPIDANWWKGEKDGCCGIFPITHVWKVDKSILPVSNTKKKMFARAKVKMNMTAQLQEEMDLYKDEIVNIIEEVEKGWYRGECNGRQGIFSASFVTILPDSSSEDSMPLPSITNVANVTEPTYDNKYGYDCIVSGITPYGCALYPFQAEYEGELSLKGGEIVNLIKHVDDNWIEGEIDGKTGIFPANFINIIVDCPKTEKCADSNEPTGDSEVNLFPPDTYGRIIHDFHSQLDGDLKLREGDTVTLIKRIDRKWYEVETDNGDSGICPESFIEVIGSGPPSYSEVMASLGGHNSSLVDVSCGFTDNSKNVSKSSRPLSFVSSASDSSFSSQSSANDKSYSKGTQQFSNDKVPENTSGLNSSFLTSDSSFSDMYSNVNYCSSRENASQGMDLINSSYDSSPQSFVSNSSSFSTASGVNKFQSNSAISEFCYLGMT